MAPDKFYQECITEGRYIEAKVSLLQSKRKIPRAKLLETEKVS